ncbi:MAG: helix-turn-helix transcriptional regulator [Aristaeellaceae bacterium]
MGISPMEALLRHRLCVAQKLLAETNLPLREISSMCGFNSESYFSRCFRRMYGCAPGSFRSMGK